MEFRCVRQSGTPNVTPPGVVDEAIIANLAVQPGSTTRFELQYRILDLNLSDAIVPAGLSAASINILSSNAAAGTFTRAQLSRAEAQNAAPAVPPTSPDTSGLPTGTASVRAGLHAPFRGGLSDSNNNTLPANGTIAANGITGILPLTISESGQGNPDAGADNNAWYGLYSFNFVAGAGGTTTITAAAVPDPNTGNTFGYFNSGAAVPLNSANSTGCTQLITVVPAPGALALLGMGGLIAGRRRRA